MSPFKKLLLTPSKFQISSPLIDIQELLQNRRLRKEALDSQNKIMEGSPEQISMSNPEKTPVDMYHAISTPEWTPSARRIEQNSSMISANLKKIRSRVSGAIGGKD